MNMKLKKPKKMVFVVKKSDRTDTHKVVKIENTRHQNTENQKSKNILTLPRIRLLIDNSRLVAGARHKAIQIVPRPRVKIVGIPPVKKVLTIIKHTAKLNTRAAESSGSQLVPAKKRSLQKKRKEVAVPSTIPVNLEPKTSLVSPVSKRNQAPVILPPKLISNVKTELEKPVIPDIKDKVPAYESEPVSPSETIERTKKVPDRWSDCGQIFFTGGKAFGISSNLRTVCIGTQSDVDSFFQHGQAESDLNFIQLDTLKKIKEIRLSEQRRAKEAENETQNGDKNKPSGLRFGRPLGMKRKTFRTGSGKKLRATAGR